MWFRFKGRTRDCNMLGERGGRTSVHCDVFLLMVKRNWQKTMWKPKYTYISILQLNQVKITMGRSCLLCTSCLWISKDLRLILDSWNQYGMFWNYQPLDMKWYKVKGWVYIAATRNVCCLISFSLYTVMLLNLNKCHSLRIMVLVKANLAYLAIPFSLSGNEFESIELSQMCGTSFS